MSLLLDALKKAAEQKKQQGDEDDAVEARPASQSSVSEEEIELSLMDVDENEVDDWSLDGVANEPKSADETQVNYKTGSVFDVDKGKTETVSLTQNMVHQAESYTGSASKASSVFSSAGALRSEDAKKKVLFGLLGLSFVCIGGLYVYDYIASISDKQAAQYRPIRSYSKPVDKVTDKTDAVLLVEQENYAELLNAKEEVSNGAAKPIVKQKVKKAPARKRLSITRQIQQETLHDILLRAFSAYEKGDYALSKAAYQRALRKENNNRDALMGLAAVAMMQKDYVSAKSHYVDLLRIDPRDAYANAGINNLLNMQSQQTTRVDQEAHLKALIEQKPKAHALYYALGNLYASQQRWPEAQRHYFQAYALDKTRPDYIYNLAVSLDHLGQYDAAARLYQEALMLAGDNQTSFSKDDASLRIAGIRQQQAGQDE